HIKAQLPATRDRYTPAPATRLFWGVATQKAKRRSSEYVSAPAARALTPTAAVVATAAPDGAGIRSRSDTGLENVTTGQPRAAASLRSVRSGFTTVGWPTAPSIGRSVIESEYA